MDEAYPSGRRSPATAPPGTPGLGRAAYGDPVESATRAVYEARAADWARLRPPRRPERAAEFSRRRLPGLPIVDLGCGPGSYFAGLGRPLVGLDGATAMLDLARRSAPDVLLVQGDLAALPFRRGSLGGAWARASFLHVPRGTLPIALAHLHAALAPGAPVEMSLLKGTGEGERPDDDFPGRHFAFWQADELGAVVSGAGFEIDDQAEQGDWLIMQARRARTLPDFVGPGMRVLVCGLNPSVISADAGFGFAGPNNRFWPAAIGSGLIDAGARRQPLRVLADRVGMTDLVKRATPGASELSRAEYRAGAARVARLVSWLSPGVTLFVGLDGWRAAVNRLAQPGLQPEPFGGAPAYVMPSTSGRNARTNLAQLIEHMDAARRLAAT
jgi:TDG/mug DNA glycosylase family protein